MLSVIMLSVVMLSVIMLSVVMVNYVAPKVNQKYDDQLNSKAT